jgi:hypothetical protein
LLLIAIELSFFIPGADAFHRKLERTLCYDGIDVLSAKSVGKLRSQEVGILVKNGIVEFRRDLEEYIAKVRAVEEAPVDENGTLLELGSLERHKPPEDVSMPRRSLSGRIALKQSVTGKNGILKLGVVAKGDPVEIDPVLENDVVELDTPDK